ncbi:hypothetical protein CFC21_015489, partial [Triticum aestivum]
VATIRGTRSPKAGSS